MQLHFVEDYKLESLFDCTKRAITNAIHGVDIVGNPVAAENDIQDNSKISCGGRHRCIREAHHVSKNVEFQVLEATDTEERSISAVQEFAISVDINPMLGYGSRDPSGQYFTYAVDLQISVPYDGGILDASFYGVDRLKDDGETPINWALAHSDLGIPAIKNHQNIWVLQDYLKHLVDTVLLSEEVVRDLRAYRKSKQGKIPFPSSDSSTYLNIHG